jgi:hypothetical protein
LVEFVQYQGMLKRKGLSRLDDGCEAAVLAGSYDFARLELNWRAAVAAPDVLGYGIHVYAFKCSRFKISLATMTPDADAWIKPLVTPAPSPMVNRFGILASNVLFSCRWDE